MEADHFISTKRKAKKGSKNKSRDPKDMKDYSEILRRRASLVTFEDRVGQQMKSFCKFFYPRRTVLRKAFLSHDTDGNGVLTQKDWAVSVAKANPEADKEFMDTVFRQDVASYKNLLNRGCRYDRRETWGNV